MDKEDFLVDFGELVSEVTPSLPLQQVTLPEEGLEEYEGTDLRGEDYQGLIKDASPLFDFSSTNLNPLQQMYIVQFALKGTKTGAARASGVSYGTVTSWLENDYEFSSHLEMVTNMITEALEEELFKRALDGSDKLLLEALRSRDKRYQSKKDVNVRGGIEHTHSWTDLLKTTKGYIDAEGEIIDES